ncbi:uncharacterized protein LOC117787832 [Drosophila innubila]|uniref:uncharacterized protein LOC117787832 n=1 Tax=Drosophila innubila TaxID=198719 RepID=UPI00148C946D|nr:uncharacterized protein LOC117787832 [Drosophila innubila]
MDSGTNSRHKRINFDGKMRLRPMVRLGMLGLGLFLGLVILPLLETSASRVIYYNLPNSEKSVEVNGNTTNSVERGMLLAVQRNPCKRGYMHDHRNRCRRVV